MSITQVILNGAGAGAIELVAGWKHSATQAFLTGQVTQKVAACGPGILQIAGEVGSIVEPLGLITALTSSGICSLAASWDNFVNGHFTRSGGYFAGGVALLFTSWKQIAPLGLESNRNIQLLLTVAFGVITQCCLKRCVQELDRHRFKAAGWGVATALFWYTLSSQSALNHIL